MVAYIAKRLASGVISLFVVLILLFIVFQVIGDPARRTLPLNASEEMIETYRIAHGYSDPFLVQLSRFIRGAVELDFGVSTVRGIPAMSVVLEALPRSLLLGSVSFVVAMSIAMILGTLAGYFANSVLDKLLQAIGAMASGIPEFWSGLVLIIVLAVAIPIFPTGGYGGIQYLVLPAIAMAIPPIGRIMYVVRESVRVTLQEPFILVARAKGLKRSTLLFKHVLRAALIPVASIGGLELTRMLIGGVIVIESVFAWPGLGRLYLDAMERYDVALVSATLFCSTAIVIGINIALDVLYTVLDPRIKLTVS